MNGRYAAVDVHYPASGGAGAAAVVAADERFASIVDVRRPGLGAHLHAEIRVPVVGVAKTEFRGAGHAIPVHRGGAARPLYVTAAGLSAERAAALVAAMAGPHRMPDALRRVDSLARRR
ncbi:hypothetical protein ACTMTJ_14040 [Phytohabitans sp. LJ34]|uniref:hypothetical protein n=1 Tax=Phytohabitans sp. LJ34 TaxID=3452217 RepID=UPI003F8AE1BE